MAEIEKNNPNPEQQEMDDISIAEQANKLLQKEREEKEKLKKELARAKLLSNGNPEEEKEVMSKEDCLKIIGDKNTCNYDYAVAVVNLVDRELEAGQPNPLGEHGQEIRDFFEEVIEDCDGDKTKFTSVYQAKLPADDPKIAVSYRARQNRRN